MIYLELYANQVSGESIRELRQLKCHYVFRYGLEFLKSRIIAGACNQKPVKFLSAKSLIFDIVDKG